MYKRQVYAVRGNNDKEWAGDLPQELRFSLGWMRFYLVHNKKDAKLGEELPHAVIFGHSHRYLEERKDGVLWLNPGSCGRRRFDLPVTMAVLEITEDRYQVKRIDFPAESKE